jgi:hypothetical protein
LLVSYLADRLFTYNIWPVVQETFESLRSSK